MGDADSVLVVTLLKAAWSDAERDPGRLADAVYCAALHSGQLYYLDTLENYQILRPLFIRVFAMVLKLVK